jgi:glucose/arabinose dehydrogenase
MNRFTRLLSRSPRSPQPSRATAARRQTFVPRVEPLEGRDVPSTVLASGLEGLFGSTVGPDGNLYVTEQIAGRISRQPEHRAGDQVRHRAAGRYVLRRAPSG